MIGVFAYYASLGCDPTIVYSVYSTSDVIFLKILKQLRRNKSEQDLKHSEQMYPFALQGCKVLLTGKIYFAEDFT